MSFHPLFEGGLCQTCRVSPNLGLSCPFPTALPCTGPEESTHVLAIEKPLVQPLR